MSQISSDHNLEAKPSEKQKFIENSETNEQWFKKMEDSKSKLDKLRAGYIWKSTNWNEGCVWKLEKSKFSFKGTAVDERIFSKRKREKREKENYRPTDPSLSMRLPLRRHVEAVFRRRRFSWLLHSPQVISVWVMERTRKVKYFNC